MNLAPPFLGKDAQLTWKQLVMGLRKSKSKVMSFVKIKVKGYVGDGTCLQNDNVNVRDKVIISWTGLSG